MMETVFLIVFTILYFIAVVIFMRKSLKAINNIERSVSASPQPTTNQINSSKKKANYKVEVCSSGAKIYYLSSNMH